MYQQYEARAASSNVQPSLEMFLDWYNAPVVTKTGFGNLAPSQFKRGPGDSYQESYNPVNYPTFLKVTYTRDGQGCIDFSKAANYKTWTNPVKSGSKVQLSKGVKNKAYGLTWTAKISIAAASRAQHFALANRMIGDKSGQGSPAGWTWHHLPQKYEMVLVDREVHRKHGHNGGKLLWT